MSRAWMLVLAGSAWLTTSCGPPPSPPPRLDQAPRQGPVPYPEGKPPNAEPAATYPLDQLLRYQRLDHYQEPGWVADLVRAGQLPPVEQRLPEEPLVVLTSGMSDGLGEYGGCWRDYSASMTDGWNWGAGRSQGWFGLNAICQEALVKSGPMYLRSDTLEPFPNLARNWTWSDDGRQLTMDLIRGARWSDGHPFTADDVLFTWEDIILDPNVNSYTSRTTWMIEDQPISLEQVDAYTVRWQFPVPFPVQRLFDMDFLDFSVSPAHVLKPHHPRYNAAADYAGFEDCLPPDQLPPVSLGPWIPVLYKTDQLMVLRRNPYYWKVDEEGRQLPYLDEVVFKKGSDGVQRTLGTLAGSLDHTNIENPSTFVEATRRMNEPDAHFSVEWGRETLGFSLLLNQSLSLGVKTGRDRALRQLFRDQRFRRALSQGIDREGVAVAITNGPFLRPWPGGLFPGSPYYDRESVVYYPFAPATSRSLLAEIGFMDTDGDGILNWTADMEIGGDMVGQNLVIALNSSEDAEAGIAISQILVALFREIGVRINYRPLKGSIATEKVEKGEWELRVERMGQEYAVPFTRSRSLAPIAREEPVWHRGGAEPRTLQPFERELVELVQHFSSEPDGNERKRIMFDYNRVYTENLYSVGVVVGYYGLALAKRFRNVPPGVPPFLYQWTWNNIRPDQIWVPKQEQIDQIMPGVLPRYEGEP